MNKKLAYFFAGLITLASTMSYTAIAKQDRVEICHILGDGLGNVEYIVIEVSGKAVDAHIRHGDTELVNGICGYQPPPIE